MTSQVEGDQLQAELDAEEQRKLAENAMVKFVSGGIAGIVAKTTYM